MKSFVIRLLGTIAVALVLGASGSALAAPKKPKATPTPAPPPAAVDQLDAARKVTRSLASVGIDATLRRGTFEIHLQAQRVGVDWEVVIDGKEPIRLIYKGGNYFVSNDDGQSWRPTKPDDDFVMAIVAPLETGKLIGDPPHRATYESLGTETVNGEQLMHLRLVPDKGDKVDINGPAEEWLASDGHGGWLLRRTKSPVTFLQKMVYADIRYVALPSDAKVDGPETDVPAKP
jgi:hypothetical protein